MILFIATVFHESNIISCYVFGLWQQWATLSAPFWCLCQKLSQSLLYFNKTLLHRSAKRLSLVTGPGLNSSLPEAKNPGIFYGSAATFHLGGSSGILQDKVRILRALVLCSPSKHVFCCTLLTLQWACVNEWHPLLEASDESYSVVPQLPHTAYGKNPLGGLYWPDNGLLRWLRW